MSPVLRVSRSGTVQFGVQPACSAGGSPRRQTVNQILRSPPDGQRRPTPISPALTSQENPLSSAFFRVSSRFGVSSRRAVEPPPRVCRLPPAHVNSFLRPLSRSRLFVRLAVPVDSDGVMDAQGARVLVTCGPCTALTPRRAGCTQGASPRPHVPRLGVHVPPSLPGRRRQLQKRILGKIKSGFRPSAGQAAAGPSKPSSERTESPDGRW